jgi:putative transposase
MANEIQSSMNQKGSCYDNAVVESFFKTLKAELVRIKKFSTIEEARSKLFEYIEVFYNRQRLHSTLGYKSPVEFESRTTLN